MIRRLRSRHRAMMFALALLTAVLIIAGLSARREVPVNPDPLPSADEVAR